ncbi:SMI1/KNR4 family protein [Streptomyces aureus]|uniref:SMI1/KNR4 family protein n=1 Tax=Streptomyces aureus TaxID=193461 RepID=UPI00055FFC4C|nr:SMI1/KNR4 family protein [Streptomyces aureus]
MSEDMWAGVRDRVLRLGRRPGADKVFGAQGHGFRLGRVMSEDQLRSLEADLGLGLPEEYRSFLLLVGGGGAGPEYGLMTPVLVDGGWTWCGPGLTYPAQPTTAAIARAPFAAEALQGQLDVHETHVPRQDAFASEEEFRRACAAWVARRDELEDAQEAGAVFLTQKGCGYASLLVMTGPHRGAVWEDMRAADEGIGPTVHDFASWYRDWLDRTEHQLGLTPPVVAG